MGDLLQLNPVGDIAIFKSPKYGYSQLTSNVWENFNLYELTQIHRQKGDPIFAEILSRMRIGQLTENDCKVLEELKHTQVPSGCISIFTTNKESNFYNMEQLNLLKSKKMEIDSKDSRRDLTTGILPVKLDEKDPHKTGGLHSKVTFAVGARYMHCVNTDVNDGLVNGATGLIVKIDIDEKSPLTGTIYVNFDMPNIGVEAKKSSGVIDCVPIRAKSIVFNYMLGNNNVRVERFQFPGTLAWGLTIHKSLGSTFELFIGNLINVKSNRSMPGQVYTMISRAKSMTTLKLIGFHKSKIVINKDALIEMDRLRLSSVIFSHTFLPAFGEQLILSLNIRKLSSHFSDITQPYFIEKASYICLSETHTNNYSIPGYS